MIEQLKQLICEEARILTGEAIEEKYLSDVLLHKKGHADAVVFPISTEEVSAVLAFAYEQAIPVTPRGAGTNLVGSTIPLSGGVVLDLSLMNRVLEIDENTLTATVEPGILLQDFQALVEEKGLFYPPDPGEKESSIGGNISTNTGGMRAVKYGVTRDYVRGLELVLANGEVVQVGSKNVKDSSGLDLKDLVIGSEGTLAVITKCTLKLLHKPEQSVSVLLSYPDLSTGISSVLEILHSSITPTAIEFIEHSVIELEQHYTQIPFPVSPSPAYLLLILDGTVQEIEATFETLQALSARTGATACTALDSHTAADVWSMRGSLVKAVEEYSVQEPMDIVVPIDQTAAFVNFVHAFEKRCGMQMITFGHAGDGNVHICVVKGNRTEEEWKQELEENMAVLYRKAFELGGLPSGEHGIGISKQSHYQENAASANLLLMRQIKAALDPKGILNANKSFLAPVG